MRGSSSVSDLVSVESEETLPEPQEQSPPQSIGKRGKLKLVAALERSEGGMDRFMDIVVAAARGDVKLDKSVTTVMNKVLDKVTDEDKEKQQVNVGVAVHLDL